MTSPGMLWRHVIINTRATWLHGDDRGFRSRKHRIHSSGDYRNPPPTGEHRGLHDYHELRSRAGVTIGRDLRPLVGRAIVEWLIVRGCRVLVVAVGKVHTHALVELPESLSTVKAIIGAAKRCASRAVKQHLPGSVWGAGGTFKPVTKESHLRRSNDYILYEQGPGAWTWSFRDRSRTGVFGRRRSPGSGAARSTALPRRVG